MGRWEAEGASWEGACKKESRTEQRTKMEIRRGGGLSVKKQGLEGGGQREDEGREDEAEPSKDCGGPGLVGEAGRTDGRGKQDKTYRRTSHREKRTGP